MLTPPRSRRIVVPTVSLQRHPESTGPATGLAVEVSRPAPDILTLSYVLSIDPLLLCLPRPTDPTRADELWRRTCFEAFISPGQGGGYCEFNFSPSGQWAAYAFEAFRRGMRNAELMQPPRIETETVAGSFRLTAGVDLAALPRLADAPAWRLGLSAILEHSQGGKSYWALIHPPGKPDFHHPDSFALELSAPEPA